MTSATEELRRMLDERGVEWKAWDGVHPITVWHDKQISYEYTERTLLNGAKPHTGEVVDGTGRLEAVIHVCSPEQAIAATLGPGACHVEDSIIDTYEYNRWEYELSCGHTIIWEDSEPPNFCPNCGKRVEVDDG